MASYLSGFKHLEIQLEDIKSATNNFDDSKVIGAGGFGKVYKGDLSQSEGKIKVAFKRLDRKYGQGDPEFFKEIMMLSSYKHDNLISLLGYCNEGNEMVLIYEYASRGSLDRILDYATLTWTQRLKICLGAAKGLSFLHDPKGTQQRVLHRDIKSANILLDENLNAKVADFGLSKISPANQPNTFLVTSPAGTHGYCDPLYMDSYQLTKESDVYSFGVVLFEVLCGRVCIQNSNGKLEVFVHFWKKCYEEKKLDEIIFPDIKHQLEPSSVKIFVDIAYRCLQKSRERRPTMFDVVEKLKVALELQEQEPIRKAAEQEYKEILKSADPPLRFLEFPVNGGKTLLSINDKGEVFCERIYIEACLDQTQYDRLEDPSGFENSRFPGGRCYYKHQDELQARVRARFLYPQITYSVNLVFRNAQRMMYCKTLHYKLNGEKKYCMVYDTYEREDGWFVVPLYQFTSYQKTAGFEIIFKGFQNNCELQVAGFEFQRLEDKIELHDKGLEDIVKAASQSLFYKSLEELEVLLSVGFYLNGYKTWFSLNENGEHSEMLSIADCLIPREGYSLYHFERHYSRFPSGIYRTKCKGFKVHIKTQFLTPSIRYTVNLLFCKDYSYQEQKYVPLRYKLEGETETSIVYLANKTHDGYSFIAKLYQFTSNGRTFDLEIVFEDHKDNLLVEGILFQPLEKVEQEQVLEDEKLSDDLLWTFNEEDLCTNILKWFKDNGQEAYAVDNNGKKSLKVSARGIITSTTRCFWPSPQSRFGELAMSTYNRFDIEKKIKCDALTPGTTYACYLVYISNEEQPVMEVTRPYEIMRYMRPYEWYIYLVIPPDTPIIGRKLDQNTHSLLNRPKLDYVPRKRSDGLMEVKVSEFQTQTTGTTNIHISLRTPQLDASTRLIIGIESVELRPIVAHST